MTIEQIATPQARTLTFDELAMTADSIARLQLPNGMIPWFDGGHCDPWNHVETAMALDVLGRHDNARLAYEWLRTSQHRNGAWSNYYRSDGTIEDTKLDSNVCAYIGTGLWHHWLCTQDDETLKLFWPMLDLAMTWVLSMQRSDGTILWAREELATPWDYALLTGCSSIRHALLSASQVAEVLGTPRPQWSDAAAQIDQVIGSGRNAFEPKIRWAMDWYYPVLSGALVGTAAKARLEEQWELFVMQDRGVRCVSDEPWITASETAECALAYAAIGDIDTAQYLLNTTSQHRTADGSYLTGLVYPNKIVFPADERSAYTGAAVILAADSLAGISPASRIFRYDELSLIRCKIRSEPVAEISVNSPESSAAR